jgi:chromosome segregation ATPase
MGGGPSHGGHGGGGGGDISGGANQPANTKQLMRLMDSLKTLGDENAALLREVQDAEAARMEAKVAREQMKQFKGEYGQRFGTLKAALEKFRKSYPEHGDQETNPVTGSDFVKATSASDQLQRQELLIRKLTADLKKEKEESKKKDAALRKYESFYREVKARSAQKAAQRQKETQQRQQPTRPQTGAPRVPR